MRKRAINAQHHNTQAMAQYLDMSYPYQRFGRSCA
jgi:hypothetical protein